MIRMKISRGGWLSCIHTVRSRQGMWESSLLQCKMSSDGNNDDKGDDDGDKADDLRMRMLDRNMLC